MDELLSPEAPSSHYPLRQSLLMMDLKCFPSGSSAMNCAEGSKDLVWHEISRPKLFSDDAFSMWGETGDPHHWGVYGKGAALSTCKG